MPDSSATTGANGQVAWASDDVHVFHERLRTAQRVARMGFWDWNVITNELYWSEEIYRIFGLDTHSFGATYDAFLTSVHPQDREFLQRSVDEALARDVPYSIDHRILLPSGEVRYVHEEGEVTRDDDGAPVRMFGVVMDVTERRELEQQLLQAQKLEAVGRLAGGLAHDLNNVLTAIAGFTEMAHASVEPGQDAADDLEQVLQSCERASALVEKLLTFTRQHVRETSVVNVNDLIQGMSKMLQRVVSERIDFQLRRAPGLPPIEADAGQLEQVLLNLVINASDAMPHGGRLLVTTDVCECEVVDKNPAVDGRAATHVVVAVADTGCGMDSETRARAFEPFFTTKEVGKGTGLGLATVQRVVRENRGHLELITDPGRGTTVRICFPASSKAPAAPAAEPVPIEPFGGGERVLVVEDDLGVRALTARILQDAGYRVWTANTPQHALEICQSENLDPDLLVTDVILPGMNGTELARILQERRRDLGILFVSGYLGETRESLLNSADSSRFLPKPFSRRELLTKIRSILAAR